jgi:aryl-alcohol dehydrogenase-like predicted oxidoreductase
MSIARIPFGRTGHKSSRVIFGAAALGRCSTEEARRVPALLLAHGVNHIDTASSYGDSEWRVGEWMVDHRADFFLATKMLERSAEEASVEFQRSLERLGVDQVDLVQLHNLTDPAQWEVALGAHGALRVAREARERGQTRFIGVTGHGMGAPAMHLRSLERFDFDSVLLPCNYAMLRVAAYAADFGRLLDVCRERHVAVQTIKALARRPWPEGTRTRRTWYEPFEAQEDVDRAVHWVLGQPGIFLNSAGDLDLLPRILDAAERFEKAPADAEMAAWASERQMEHALAPGW